MTHSVTFTVTVLLKLRLHLEIIRFKVINAKSKGMLCIDVDKVLVFIVTNGLPVLGEVVRTYCDEAHRGRQVN